MSDKRKKGFVKVRKCLCDVLEDGTHVFTEEKWENQRFVFGGSWRNCPVRGFKDPPCWSNLERTENRHEVVLPRDWKWLDEWKKDASSGDQNAWRYASKWFGTYQVRQRTRDIIRRRRWIKHRAYYGPTGGCMNQQPAKDIGVMYQGWLYKRGEDVFKLYKKRHFRLRSDRQIFYYKSDKSKEANGLIDLSRIKKVERFSDSTRKWGLQLHTTDRIYWLAADNHEDIETWQSVLAPLLVQIRDRRLARGPVNIEHRKNLQSSSHAAEQSHDDDFRSYSIELDDRDAQEMDGGDLQILRVPDSWHQCELRESREPNWFCNGMDRPSGCLSGCTTKEDTKGLSRFRCEACDFSLCRRCVDQALTEVRLKRRDEISEDERWLQQARDIAEKEDAERVLELEHPTGSADDSGFFPSINSRKYSRQMSTKSNASNCSYGTFGYSVFPGDGKEQHRCFSCCDSCQPREMQCCQIM